MELVPQNGSRFMRKLYFNDYELYIQYKQRHFHVKPDYFICRQHKVNKKSGLSGSHIYSLRPMKASVGLI